MLSQRQSRLLTGLSQNPHRSGGRVLKWQDAVGDLRRKGGGLNAFQRLVRHRGGLFVTVLITSNIIVIKPVQVLNLPFSILGSSSVVLTAAAAIFPISYILGDVLTEVYGYRVARGVIWLGFAANLLVVMALVFTGIVPGEPSEWTAEHQKAYDLILGQVPGILVASFVAYLFGELSNSTVLALLKYKMQGRMLWVRTIGSTAVGQGLDSFIFTSWPLALFPVCSEANPGAPACW